VAVGWVAKIIAAGLSWIENFGKVGAAVAAVVDWIRSHWPLLLAILTGPIGLAVLYIVDHWHQITSGAEDMVGKVVSFFEGLPRRILSAVGDLGSLLFSAGERVIEGLINGITSQIGEVGSAMSGIVGEIKNFLPFSPAKKGPLSGSGSPDKSGLSITRMLAQGITSGTGNVSSAMARVTAAVAGAGAGSGLALAGAGGGAWAMTVTVQKTGDKLIDDIMEGIRLEVRHKGGGGPQSVQKALGQTW